MLMSLLQAPLTAALLLLIQPVAHGSRVDSTRLAAHLEAPQRGGAKAVEHRWQGVKAVTTGHNAEFQADPTQRPFKVELLDGQANDMRKHFPALFAHYSATYNDAWGKFKALNMEFPDSWCLPKSIKEEIKGFSSKGPFAKAAAVQTLMEQYQAVADTLGSLVAADVWDQLDSIDGDIERTLALTEVDSVEGQQGAKDDRYPSATPATSSPQLKRRILAEVVDMLQQAHFPDRRPYLAASREELTPFGDFATAQARELVAEVQRGAGLLVGDDVLGGLVWRAKAGSTPAHVVKESLLQGALHAVISEKDRSWFLGDMTKRTYALKELFLSEKDFNQRLFMLIRTFQAMALLGRVPKNNTDSHYLVCAETGSPALSEAIEDWEGGEVEEDQVKTVRRHDVFLEAVTRGMESLSGVDVKGVEARSEYFASHSLAVTASSSISREKKAAIWGTLYSGRRKRNYHSEARYEVRRFLHKLQKQLRKDVAFVGGPDFLPRTAVGQGYGRLLQKLRSEMPHEDSEILGAEEHPVILLLVEALRRSNILLSLLLSMITNPSPQVAARASLEIARNVWNFDLAILYRIILKAFDRLDTTMSGKQQQRVKEIYEAINSLEANGPVERSALLADCLTAPDPFDVRVPHRQAGNQFTLGALMQDLTQRVGRWPLTLADVNSGAGGEAVLGMLSLAKAVGAVANDGNEKIPRLLSNWQRARVQPRGG